ncbi:hypothetical protein KCU81_g656, partial [Aureobasidium melanogenum]
MPPDAALCSIVLSLQQTRSTTSIDAHVTPSSSSSTESEVTSPQEPLYLPVEMPRYLSRDAVRGSLLSINADMSFLASKALRSHVMTLLSSTP